MRDDGSTPIIPCAQFIFNRDFRRIHKKAGLLTPEEIEADEQERARRREWQKQWRDKKKVAEPLKPPKQLSQNEIIRRKYAGLPLNDEEYAIYRAWQDKKS